MERDSSCWTSEADELYFEWLCEMVEGHKYYYLLNHLHTIPFVWLIPNDDNRLSDGLALRQSYCENLNFDIFSEEILGENPCSVLEMLVALAIRMADMIADPEEDICIHEMFFRMLSNLDLTRFDDRNYVGVEDCKDGFAQQALRQDMSFVDHKINIFLSRKYHFDGFGGLFPLIFTEEDQRKVEIWYQMTEYVMQNFYDRM